MAGSATADADRVRAGGQVLCLLSDAINTSILRALLRGPLPVAELAHRLGPTSRTTRFARLRELEDLGVVSREKRSGGVGTPPVAYCSLTSAGRGLLPVARRFARWLASDPDGPSSPVDLTGAQKIKALANAWNTTVLRWLAEGPRSLTELDTLSPPVVTYHEARKAREDLSEAGLITPVATEDRGQPYGLVSWARQITGCIAAAIAWEGVFLDPSVPIASIDAETLLLLLLPLIECAPGPRGSVCALQVDRSGDLPVTTVGEGRVITGSVGFESGRASRIQGSADAWFQAIASGQTESLRMQGRIHLTSALVSGMHGECTRPPGFEAADTMDKCPTTMCAI